MVWNTLLLTPALLNSNLGPPHSSQPKLTPGRHVVHIDLDSGNPWMSPAANLTPGLRGLNRTAMFSVVKSYPGLDILIVIAAAGLEPINTHRLLYILYTTLTLTSYLDFQVQFRTPFVLHHKTSPLTGSSFAAAYLFDMTPYLDLCRNIEDPHDFRMIAATNGTSWPCIWPLRS